MSSVPTLLTRQARARGLRPALIVSAALAIAVGSYGWALLGGREPISPPVAPAVHVDAPATEIEPLQPLADIDRAIGVWTANLDRDRADFIAATQLAELYLGRARLTADPADLDRALDASARALHAHPDLTAAHLLQAQVRLAQHDFDGARGDAQSILAAHPELPQALATLGDAELELGLYDAAAGTYDALGATASGPAVLARQARLASVTGDLAGARQMATDALAAARDGADTALTELAWYHTLSASLAFQAGDVAAAGAAYEAALESWPSSSAALAGLARVRAAEGATAEAIELYQRSVAVVPNLDALATLGDLLAAEGRTDEAGAAFSQARAVAALGTDSGLADRQWALFLANHGEDPALAVQVAAADLERRADVYAHDAYAWALFAAGRLTEAEEAIRSARAQGTEDALLDYHAGMIAAALHRDDEARALLAGALDRNPDFDPVQAPRAAAALAALEADR
jgi:lipopolysaccharide biosynthesis regulator YciM